MAFFSTDVKPAFTERNIAVAFSTDANYLPYVAVAINSLAANSLSGNLDVLILHDGIADASMSGFFRGIRKSDRLSVRFVNIKGALDGTQARSFVQHNHLSVASLYRLILPEILPKYDRILYLDVDIVVCGDLSELYNTDMRGCLFAGVKDFAIEAAFVSKESYREFASSYGFNDWNGYVNAGVLLLDLAALRHAKLFDEMLPVAVAASQYCADQEAINFICKDRILQVEPRWNLLAIPGSYERQLDATKGQFSIVHFTGRAKPWNSPWHMHANIWWSHVLDHDFAIAQLRKAFGISGGSKTIGDGVAVSVIIPVYNAEHYIAEMLLSLSAQTLANIEIICVDDGSTDGSRAVCERFAAHDSRIRIVAQKNSGGAIARNRGIEEANGRWLFFADADDLCRPDMLADMVADGEAKSAEIVVAGRMIVDCRQVGMCYKAGVPVEYLKKEQPVSCHANGVNVFSGLGFAPWNKLYRADFVRASGIRYHQTPPNDDVFFVLATLIAAKRIAMSSNIYYYYRQFLETSQMGQGDKHPTNFLVALREVRDVVAKHDKKVQREFFAVAIASCFENLIMRKTNEGIMKTYSALRDGGLLSLHLPFADETCVDIGICRKAFALTLAKADMLDVFSAYCRDKCLSLSARSCLNEAAVTELRAWLWKKTEQNKTTDERLKAFKEAHNAEVARLKEALAAVEVRLKDKTKQYVATDERLRDYKETYKGDVARLKARIAALDTELAKSKQVLRAISKTIE